MRISIIYWYDFYAWYDKSYLDIHGQKRCDGLCGNNDRQRFHGGAISIVEHAWLADEKVAKRSDLLDLLDEDGEGDFFSAFHLSLSVLG